MPHPIHTLKYIKKDKPFMLVKFRLGAREFTTPALVDSGADHSIITAELAECLGIPLDRLPRHRITGIGGVIELSSLYLTAEIPGTDIGFEAKAFFGRDYKGGVNLLGRKPLFSMRKVRFDDYGQELTLE